jgi:phosphoglucosamine mutase
VTRRLFGTDGIRGIAGQPPLDGETVSRLGLALGEHLRASGAPIRMLLAGDTRASTVRLAGWIAGAFRASGGEVVWAGVLPTPAVSHLLRDLGGFGAGVIVSASHNPAEDNGIKLMTDDGAKWPVKEERALEERMAALPRPDAHERLPQPPTDLSARAVERLAATLPPRSLDGMYVVVDAAHGAASLIAERFFAALAARVDVINAAPDGRNINAGCGALFPARLAAEVTRRRADAGVALDGDADRAILVTGAGRILSGDDALLIWARHLALAGKLDGGAVVATVMSNLALEHAFRREGIRLVRCPVGDREVWETMVREGAVLGGEQSGHVICSLYSVTGDGLLTAAHVLAAATARQEALETLADLRPFPQVLHNVRVARRRPLAEVAELAAAIRAAEAELDGEGRVLVRFSGTEPVLRVMVEAPSAGVAETTAQRIAEAAHSALG